MCLLSSHDLQTNSHPHSQETPFSGNDKIICEDEERLLLVDILTERKIKCFPVKIIQISYLYENARI